MGTYHHFEWAIGTGEGKSDILEFEDVGMNRKVQVNGLDLGGLSACFITLRAWKLDGRCTELCVKAHALNGQPCVHRRLVIGDGFVTITKGESIRKFFEHAEEAEEEEVFAYGSVVTFIGQSLYRILSLYAFMLGNVERNETWVYCV